MSVMKRFLAGERETRSIHCNNDASFLGVGNTECLHDNIETAAILLAVIVAVSISVEKFIHFIRGVIKCPQLRRIVNRIFEEMMIMGFLSMVIFALNTSGAMVSLTLNELTAYENLRFYEFFHYIVFLTMIYFIIIVLLLLFIGTVVPKLIWDIKQTPGQCQDGTVDIHGNDTYDTRDPSFSTGFSSDCTGNNYRMRHSFIRGTSFLDREINPYGRGSSTGDGEHGPHGDCNLSVQSRANFDEDGVYHMMATRARALSGMDLVLGSRAYSLLLQRYQREGWCLRINIHKQWKLWKSFEILAYNICQNRSGYIYKNPIEMERLFGIKSTTQAYHPDFKMAAGGDANYGHREEGMTYAKYHVLCMRNMLFHMTHIPPSAFLIFIVICMLPTLFPEQDRWIFIGVGVLLLLVNVIVFFKVLKILRGIVDDRLHIISEREIDARMTKVLMASRRLNSKRQIQSANVSDSNSAPESAGHSSVEEHDSTAEDGHENRQTPPVKGIKKFRAAALAVRAVIRMQMSALCHRQLHYHDDRFWFHSPKFLLRLFQFATIGQAFYLVWFSLVEIASLTDSTNVKDGEDMLLLLMAIFPALSLFVVTPLTMPSLVLVMSLTGIFVELNTIVGDEEGKHRHVTEEEIKTHTRFIRRTYLRSHYTDDGNLQQPSGTPTYGPVSPAYWQEPAVEDRASVASSTNVFLRVYDSPAPSIGSVLGEDRGSVYYPSNDNSVGGNTDFDRPRYYSQSNASFDNRRSDDHGHNPRRTFNLREFQSLENDAMAAPERANNRTRYPYRSASSFTSNTSSSSKTPRPTRKEVRAPSWKKSWSQADVDPPGMRAGSNADAESDREGDLEHDRTSGAGSYMAHCSKYGGYADV
uniref:Uncharacterized protein n=1 Tax=Peronospora matthiolae TaxID=2874970 RepID=A0AAV1T7L4_9STRA